MSPSVDLLLDSSPRLDQLVLSEVILTCRWCGAGQISEYNLDSICEILLSPVYKKIKPKQIVEWILQDNLNVRFQMQMHKEVWPESVRGV